MRSPLSRPRGPLPASIYWRRRAVALALTLVVVVGVVVGVQRLIGWSGGDDNAATPTAGDPAASTSATEPDKQRKGKRKDRDRPSPPAEPDGPCSPEEVAVEPVVPNAHAGGDVRIRLRLTSTDSAACDWTLSAESMTVKITSGSDDIWFSSECPAAVPEEQLVLRKDKVTGVDLMWNARRSDEKCSNLTEWALPGTYYVSAAALGGEPTAERFTLDDAVQPTVTKTAKPRQQPSSKPKKSPSPSPDDRSSDQPTDQPTGDPSGAVEPTPSARR